MATKLNMTLLLRRGVFSDSYVLQAGEPGYHTGTKVLKIGDGTTTWGELKFANQAQIEALIKVVDDKVAALGETYATDEEVRLIKEALEASIKTITDELDTYGDIVTHNAADFDEAGAAAAVAGDLADYESANDERVKAIEDELDTFGDIVTRNVAEFATAAQGATADATAATVAGFGDVVTHNASEFESAGAAAAVKSEIETKLEGYYTEGEADAKFETIANVDLVRADITAINAAETGIYDRAKAYVDGKFTDANLDQYTTEQEVKDIVDGVIAAAADDETYNSLTKLIDYVDTHKGEAIDMAEDIADHETRIGALEAKPAAGITETQISNWDGEVGAKALAQGVKDVVDANKATWDKAGTALQAADLADYAKSADVTAEIGEAIADEVARADAAYDAKGTAQDIVDALKLDETYEPIGAEARAKSYTDTEIADFNTETVAPIAARVKAIEDAPYATTANVATAKQEAIDAAKEYSDSLEHNNTTYVVAATENALEFTVTPSEGEAQTVKLVAPTVDVGVTQVVAGTDIVVTPEAGTGVVTVAHKAYETGTVKDAAHNSATDPSFITGISIENGHVTGATVRNLAEVLTAMEFILDCGAAE